MLQNEVFERLISKYLHHGWRKFWFSWSGIPQNEGLQPLIPEYLHHGWRKFLIFVLWNAPEWRLWTAYRRISSPWLKTISWFCGLECSRMKDLDSFRILSSCLKKVLIFVVWSAPEWRIWNANLRIYSPRLKKIFDIFTMVEENSFNFVVWNAPEWRIWTVYVRIS